MLITGNDRDSRMLLFGHQMATRSAVYKCRKSQKAVHWVVYACVSTREYPKHSRGALRAARKQKYVIFVDFRAFII